MSVIYQVETYVPEVCVEREDGGAAVIFQPCYASREDFEASKVLPEEERDHGMFVRIQSYDERIWTDHPDAHAEIKRILGKKIRITVEIIE
jgi:hypothetical protein